MFWGSRTRDAVEEEEGEVEMEEEVEEKRMIGPRVTVAWDRPWMIGCWVAVEWGRQGIFASWVPVVFPSAPATLCRFALF